MTFQELKQLSAKSPEEILKILGKEILGEGSDNPKDFPHLHLGYSSGIQLTGLLLNYAEKDGNLVIAHEVGSGFELQYANVYGLQMITVLNPNSWADELSEGRIAFTPPSSKVPSSLEFKSIVAGYSNEIQQILGSPFSYIYPEVRETPEVFRYQVKTILQLTQEALISIMADPMGRDAFLEKVQQVQIELGDENIKLEGKVLQLSIPMQQSKKPQVSKSKLQSEIEAIL